MRSIIAAALAGATLVATPVLAQDGTYSAPADAPMATTADTSTTMAETTADAPFAGIYAGGSFGFAAQPNDAGSSILFDRNLDGRFGDTVTLANTGANAFSPGFCNGRATGNISPAIGGRGCRKDKDGIEYYGRLGIDSQQGNIVFGVVGEFGKPEIRDSVTAFSTTPAFYTMNRTVDWEASIRGRIGFAVDTTLFYGAFGPGYAKIDRSFQTGNLVNAFAGRGDRQQWGITGGGGIEQKIGKNFSIGLEYMYHQYQDDDYRIDVTRGSAPLNNPFVLAPNTTGTTFRRSDDMFRWHSMRVTAGFRF
ncbi:outer membrane protein [Sphingomonas rubra]|uniref:Outer membrane immunogenic protein n=1 Tax=Sphingomonas rubra TaxID=634430 RepID=A0A1I5UG40_9SPHN|nr:outer membrane beta-barrel protein [Sphingomonas rubra]SFP94243.1 outer membrane immunogenic protein [Sphingomonas rubra]